MPYPSEIAIRMKDPGQYNRFIRKNLDTGVDAIIGFKSGSGSEVQALRFDKTRFSVAEARKWASSHGFKSPISVEPAKESSDHMAVSDVVVRGVVRSGKTENLGVRDGKGPLGGTALCPHNEDDEEDLEDMTESKKIDEMIEKDDKECWVEAFKIGTHTDSDGDVKDWTADDIKTIADKYNAKVATDNPERRVAPVVLGHPTADAPAYGWVEKAKVLGDKLMLKLSQLQPAFVNALKEGLYKTRSISLYPDLNIRHLGFLGAAQPAVAGLAPFKFASEEKYDTYEFSQEDSVDVNMLKTENKFFKRLFELFHIDVKNFKGDGNMADTKIETKVEPKIEPTAVVAPVEKKVEMTEPVVEKKVEPVVPPVAPVIAPVVPVVDFTEEIKALKAEIVILKAELAANKVEKIETSYKEFVDKLVTEGRCRPVDVEQTIINLKARAELDKAKNFAETDELKSSVHQYKEYLSTMPKIVEFNELITGKVPENKPANFVEEEISKMMKADPTLQYHVALNKVGLAHPEKVKEYVEASYQEK